PGKVVRVRRPEKVVEEMLHLNRRHGVRVFLFQDDDFPLWGKKGRRWADELVGRLHDSGLAESTVWKISCRAEYVEPSCSRACARPGSSSSTWASNPASRAASTCCSSR